MTTRLLLGVWVMRCGVSLASGALTVTTSDYARAERFLWWNKDQYVINADIQHHWIGMEDRFWYLRTTLKIEKEFVVVDAKTGSRKPAFDQRKIAKSLSKAVGKHFDPGALPFSVFRYASGGKSIQFEFSDERWVCWIRNGQCVKVPLSRGRANEALSPDGKWAAFLQEHNLWVRPTAGGPPFALTSDGVEHDDYASLPGDNLHAVSDLRHSKPVPPLVIWSPDSRFILTHRLDERKVKEMYLIQSTPQDGSVRPKLYRYRFALPGDENVAQLEPTVFGVQTRQRVQLATPPLIAGNRTLIGAHRTWWSANSTKIYYLDTDRFSKSLSLYSADPRSGAVVEILREVGKTWVQSSDGISPFIDYPLVRVLTHGDVIWYSQRDGWGHLYYYEGATGKLRNQITRGAWAVRGIVRIDEAAGEIYFLASGREAGQDPYYQHLYRVGMDGSGLTLLTPEDAEHLISTADGPLDSASESDADGISSPEERHGFSASGRYFVYSYSRPDTPPVLVLRTAEGRLIEQLEVADLSALRKGGYTPVEPFEVRAADGKTAIYGNLFRPSDFDPSKRYPVIDSVAAAPHVSRTWKSFLPTLFDDYGGQDLAELGFIVVTVDGRGTPHRSKAFLDYCYGQLGKASDLDDHIAGLRQLAQRYSYMDLRRVGIYGYSGGGYASTEAILRYPEFYKVAVSAEGNHDQQGYMAPWGETYNGPVGEGDYQDAANESFAANLKGKLLLMHGEMDDNVSPSLTMKVVDALIKANKDFDLLIIPNGNHMIAQSPYFIRRKWDYFVRNMLGAEPPLNYEIKAPQPVLDFFK